LFWSLIDLQQPGSPSDFPFGYLAKPALKGLLFSAGHF
jgi:hypothetical protein